MPEPSPPPRPAELDSRPLAWLMALTAAALACILAPFFGVILWATVIALLFAPLHRRLTMRLPGRPNTAALWTMLAVLLMVVLPCLGVAAMMAVEATLLYDGLASGELTPVDTLHGWYDTLPGWARRWLKGMGLGSFGAVQAQVVGSLKAGTQFIATQVFNLGQSTFVWLAQLGVTLYLAFYMLRDGATAVRRVGRLVPMAPRHQLALATRFGSVVRATVRGTLLVAALQGTLGGLAFWVLDVRGALLWGVLMAFLSLLPAIGAALVWAPVAVMLFISGQAWQAVALAAYGVLVIGLADNLLRPVLVGREARLPDSLVMLSTLGGLALFGLNGFVIGPAVAALFLAVGEIHAGPWPPPPE